VLSRKRANDRLQAELESKSRAGQGGGARSKGKGGGGDESQGDMLIQMAVQRRISAEVEFAKKKLAAAQKVGLPPFVPLFS